jgi:translation initiation factor 5A
MNVDCMLIVKSYIDDGFLHLIQADGTEKNDVRVPEGEIGSKITEYDECGEEAIITVIYSMGKELAIGVKST